MERTLLQTAIDLVLRDAGGVLGPEGIAIVRAEDAIPLSELELSNPTLLEVLSDPRHDDGVAAWVFVPGEAGLVGLPAPGDVPFAALVVDVAETVQEVVMEGERDFGRAFPPCPVHQGHPLWPEVRGTRAMWVCLADPAIALPVGTIDVGPTL